MNRVKVLGFFLTQFFFFSSDVYCTAVVVDVVGFNRKTCFFVVSNTRLCMLSADMYDIGTHLSKYFGYQSRGFIAVAVENSFAYCNILLFKFQPAFAINNITPVCGGATSRFVARMRISRTRRTGLERIQRYIVRTHMLCITRVYKNALFEKVFASRNFPRRCWPPVRRRFLTSRALGGFEINQLAVRLLHQCVN